MPVTIIAHGLSELGLELGTTIGLNQSRFFVQEIGDLLTAAVDFSLTNLPKFLLDHGGYLTHRTRLSLALVTGIQKGQQAMFSNVPYPAIDRIAIGFKTPGDLAVADALLM